MLSTVIGKIEWEIIVFLIYYMEVVIGMDRNEAINVIATKKCETLTKEDRDSLICGIWGIDESDEEFYLVSKELQEELLKFDAPQEDIMSSRYDMLVKIACEINYCNFLNEELEETLSETVGTPTIVTGKNPKRYLCPCCGKETLSMRAEYDICFNCGWEDSGCEEEDDYSFPNHMTLGEGRKNYRLYGSCDKPKSIDE